MVKTTRFSANLHAHRSSSNAPYLNGGPKKSANTETIPWIFTISHDYRASYTIWWC
ncbi:hypothetical protein [Rubritalea tangerina]|uniref:hypothetical protein n=1 Tax=Rubritalea tangerina TaxID=430798 RepID=UPI00362129A3